MNALRVRRMSLLLAVCSVLGLVVLGGASAASAAPATHIAGTIWTMAPANAPADQEQAGVRPVQENVHVTPYGTIWT